MPMPELSPDELQEWWTWNLNAMPAEYTPAEGWPSQTPLESTLRGFNDVLQHPSLVNRDRASSLGLAAFYAQADRAAVSRSRADKGLLHLHHRRFAAEAQHRLPRILGAVARGQGETMAHLRTVLDLARGLDPADDILIPLTVPGWADAAHSAFTALKLRALRQYPDFYNARVLSEKSAEPVAALLGEIGLLERSDSAAPETIRLLRAARISGAVAVATRMWKMNPQTLWGTLPPTAQKTLKEAAGWIENRRDPLRVFVPNTSDQL